MGTNVRLSILCMVVMAAFVPITTAAGSAVTLYGVDSITNTLMTIDTSNGSSSAIGVGTYTDSFAGHAVGLAYNPLTGVLYSRSFDNLYTVDIGTGNTTLVGLSRNDITGLTFDSTYSTLYSVSQFDGSFYSVDPSTGTSTLIGNTGLTGNPIDLSTHSDGTIYGASLAGEIFTVDVNTGLATVVISGLPRLTAIEFDANDKLYGVDLEGKFLAIIDFDEEIFDPVGVPIGFLDVRGLAFIPEPASAIIGTIGILACGLRRRCHRVVSRAQS